MNLNETQLSWIIEKLEEIRTTSTPWNVRDQLKVFNELLKSRLTQKTTTQTLKETEEN